MVSITERIEPCAEHCAVCGELAELPSAPDSRPHCLECESHFLWLQEWLTCGSDVAPQAIRLSTPIREALQCDSFGALELILDMERKFGIAISDEVGDRLMTVQDAVIHIRSAQQ